MSHTELASVKPHRPAPALIGRLSQTRPLLVQKISNLSAQRKCSPPYCISATIFCRRDYQTAAANDTMAPTRDIVTRSSTQVATIDPDQVCENMSLRTHPANSPTASTSSWAGACRTLADLFVSRPSRPPRPCWRTSRRQQPRRRPPPRRRRSWATMTRPPSGCR